MQIIDWQQFLTNGITPKNKLSSMTVGIFDGVHLGHQKLLKQIVSYNANYVPVVVTFRQNHKTEKAEYETPSEQKNIQTFEQRLKIFKTLGIQITVVIDFTDEFKEMPGIMFLETLLKHGNVGFFAVGQNFRCGCSLDTDANVIQEFFASSSIPVKIIPEVCYPLENSYPQDNLTKTLPISSSRIRAAIAAGDFSLAEVMLGSANYGQITDKLL